MQPFVFSNRLSLRRITSSGAYIPELDGLRFVAIAAVVLYHVAVMTEIHTAKHVTPHSPLLALSMNTLFHGYEGVRLFFIISGFILGLPFANYYLCGGKPVDLRSYFWRRITRLEPPYIANLLIRFVPTMAAKHMSFAQVFIHFLASLFYLHVVVFGTEPVVHGASWSLEVEVQFYLVAPFIALALFRYRPVLRRISMMLIIAGAGFLQIHRPDGSIRIEMSILNYGQFFLAGILLADLYVTVLPHWRSSWIWDAVCLPLWFLVFSLPLNAAHVVIPSACLILCIGAFKGKLLRQFFRLPAISTMGGMCYSIYLTHSLVIQGCFSVLDRLRLLRRGFYPSLLMGELFTIPVILGVGTCFFVFIERPCMDKNWPAKLGAYLKTRFSTLFPAQAATEA